MFLSLSVFIVQVLTTRHHQPLVFLVSTALVAQRHLFRMKQRKGITLQKGQPGQSHVLLVIFSR